MTETNFPGTTGNLGRENDSLPAGEGVTVFTYYCLNRYDREGSLEGEKGDAVKLGALTANRPILT